MLNLLGELSPELTVHGFRASFRTWCDEETAAHSDVKEACLAHKLTGDETSLAYRRSDLFKKRQALMAAWADYLDANATGKVVALRKA